MAFLSEFEKFTDELLQFREHQAPQLERELVDLVISARWVIPVIPEKIVYEFYSVVINNGTIQHILPIMEAEKRFEARSNPPGSEKFFQRHAIIPGLCNLHTHSAMVMFRGIAEDVSLMEWLQEYIWPMEKKWVSEEFCETGLEMALCEMIRSGTTSFSEMYFHPEVSARVADRVGVRALIATPLLSGFGDLNENISKGVALYQQYKENPRVHAALGPHAPYTVDDEAFQKIAEQSRLHPDLRIHIHLHETEGEVERAVSSNQERPFSRLKRLGVLTKNTIAVHMTQLTLEEIKEAAEIGLHLCHCPESNLKLNSGNCPIAQVYGAGVNVCIGTDGAASNDDLDLLGEVRTAALVDRLVSGDRPNLSSHTFLSIATINGAKAMGIENIAGSLEIGKAADLVAIEMRSEPNYHLFNNLAFVGTHRVSDVWVAGQQLLSNGNLMTLDEKEVFLKAQRLGEKIAQHLKELGKL